MTRIAENVGLQRALFLRVSQISASVLVLVVAISTFQNYNQDFSVKLSMVLSLATVCYLVLLSVISLFLPSLLMSGPIVGLESALFGLWLFASISTIEQLANRRCSGPYYDHMNDSYGYYDLPECRLSKVLPAMSLLNMVLFAVSASVYTIKVALVAFNKKSFSNLWTLRDSKRDRLSWLCFVGEETVSHISFDPENEKTELITA